MRIEEHVGKCDRIERSSGKFDRDLDYELFVEACMLAGTHLLNAVLHRQGITGEDEDLLHSDKPPLDRPVPEPISEMMRKLKQIEDLRARYLRNKTAWQTQHGELCASNLHELRAAAGKILCQDEVKL